MMERTIGDLNSKYGMYDPERGIANEIVIRLYKETIETKMQMFYAAIWLFKWMDRVPVPNSPVSMQAIRSRIGRVVAKASKLRGSKLEKFKAEPFVIPDESVTVTTDDNIDEASLPSTSASQLAPGSPPPVGKGRSQRLTPQKKCNINKDQLIRQERKLNLLELKVEKAKAVLGHQEEKNARYSVKNVKKREDRAKAVRASLRQEKNKYRDMANEQKRENIEMEEKLGNMEEKLRMLEERNRQLEKRNNELKKKVVVLRKVKRKASMRAVYYERRYRSLRKKGINVEDTLKSNDEEEKMVVTTEDGKFTPETRLCVMELTGLEVATEKVAPVMETVGSLCGVKFSNLPSRQVSQNIVDEGHVVAKSYIRERMLKSRGFGLHKDGTSRKKVKILDTSMRLESGESFCLGWSSVSAETGKAIADETVEKLGELRDEGDDEVQLKEMVLKLKYYMSDRAANEKKSNEFLDKWREDVLKDLGEESLPTIHHLYCSAHVLLGFHNYTISSISKMCNYESHDAKHPITKVLKDASDMFGPVGDFRGLRNQWEAYCEENGLKSLIKAYKDNRFNGLFEISAQVYHHHQDFLKLLSIKTAPNFKQNRLLQSLQSPHTLLLLECLGLFFHHVTGPFWSMVISKKMSFQDLVPVIKSLHQSLINISESPQLFFDPSNFPHLNKFEASSQETKASLSTHMKKGMEDIIATISTALSDTIKAQLSDFLDGGKYSDPSKLVGSSFAPLSNLISERHFGHLDASQKRRPHGSLHHHTSVMLLKQTRPKLREWYRRMDEQGKKALWAKACKKGKEMRKRHRDQDRRAIMESLPTMKSLQVDKATIEKTLVKDQLIIVACQDNWYPAVVQNESSSGQSVMVDFAERGKLLGAFKWPSGHDIHEVSRSSILEMNVNIEPRAGGRSWIINDAKSIQSKFKKSL